VGALTALTDVKRLLFLLLLLPSLAFGQDGKPSTAARPDTADWKYQRSKIKDETFFISLDPSAQHYFNRGQLRSQIQDYPGAIADLSRCIALAPEVPEVYYARGAAKERQGDLPGALAYFTQLVTLRPSFAEGWNDRGQTYIKVNKFAEAEADLRQALVLRPGWAVPFFNLGLVYAGQNNPLKAVEYYTKSIELDTTNPLAYNNLGRMYFKLKKYDQAIRCYTQSIGIFPQYLNAFTNRAEAKMAIGDQAGACQDIKAAADLGDAKSLKYFREFYAKN